jgi:hypothetical protein
MGAKASSAFERALSMSMSGALRVIALRELARGARRGRRYKDAAERWRQLLDLPGCPSNVRREASEALAIHHEHRVVDLEAAKAFALGSLDAEARPSWNDAVQYRVARIERKIERSPVPGLLAYLLP